MVFYVVAIAAFLLILMYRWAAQLRHTNRLAAAQPVKWRFALIASSAPVPILLSFAVGVTLAIVGAFHRPHGPSWGEGIGEAFLMAFAMVLFVVLTPIVAYVIGARWDAADDRTASPAWGGGGLAI